MKKEIIEMGILKMDLFKMKKVMQREKEMMTEIGIETDIEADKETDEEI